MTEQYMNIGLIIVDAELRVQHLNEVAHRINGSTAATVAGYSLVDLVSKPAFGSWRALADKLMNTSSTPDLADGVSDVQFRFSSTGSHAALALSLCFAVPSPAGDTQIGLVFFIDAAANSPTMEAGHDEREPAAASEQSQSSSTEVVGQADLLQQLERANRQLLQSEKLAAIGQLAAGVAHEINNPIGYVSSNLKTLVDYIKDLLLVTDSLDTAVDLEAVRHCMQAIEYDNIRGDIEDLLRESEEGIQRVKQIITALKDFSYIEEEEFRYADLHRCLDTTLNVVNNELKYKAEVVKEYGEPPQVECMPSQINQVVMNLLLNAAQSIDTFGRITLRTGSDDAWAWLEVDDTGRGIEPQILNRLFEPFFTTKPVGKGTGLGLSLSYNIINKHRGRIEVFSARGKGARFRVWLPISQMIIK